MLKRLYVLVFIQHGTRRMHLGGVTERPTHEWTVQQARNLAMSLGEQFEDIKFLLRDRGPDFTGENVLGCPGPMAAREVSLPEHGTGRMPARPPTRLSDRPRPTGKSVADGPLAGHHGGHGSVGSGARAE